MAKQRRKRQTVEADEKEPRPPLLTQPPSVYDPSKLEEIPATYQALHDHFGKLGDVVPFALRNETFLRIERLTGRPLICYVTKTHHLSGTAPTYIDDSDLIGFADLVRSTEGGAVDVVIISNGGSAEATERIVRLLRNRFGIIRFIVPGNAYSAATLLCLSGDEIIMDAQATLGPIDPQINGIPARAILRAFESVEERLKSEGPQALTAYLPLIEKYDLHIFEICKSAQELSKELAGDWLSEYMLRCARDDPRIINIVKFFSDYDAHKSHGRSIDRERARAQGLQVADLESYGGLADLVRSLYNQYEIWFDRMPFYKMFENARGIHWGRRLITIAKPRPSSKPQPSPQPGSPRNSSQEN